MHVQKKKEKKRKEKKIKKMLYLSVASYPFIVSMNYSGGSKKETSLIHKFFLKFIDQL